MGINTDSYKVFYYKYRKIILSVHKPPDNAHISNTPECRGVQAKQAHERRLV